jgi:hypothetical protein
METVMLSADVLMILGANQPVLQEYAGLFAQMEQASRAAQQTAILALKLAMKQLATGTYALQL